MRSIRDLLKLTLPSSLILSLIAGLAGLLAPSPTVPQVRAPSAANFAIPLYTGETLRLDGGVLRTPREAFAAAVLPDGQVLVIGGRDRRGNVIAKPELYDAQRKAFSEKDGLALASRVAHTATTLTDGRILLVGGLDESGRPTGRTEVLDPVTWERAEGPTLGSPRSGHTARLLPSGHVAIEGGVGADGRPVIEAEIFDPRTASVGLYTEALRQEHEVRFASEGPAVAEILPPHESRNVDIEEFVSIRFSEPVDPASLNAESVTLLGPTGVLPLRIVPAEDGMLAFVSARESLRPDSRYSVFVQGVATRQGKAIPFSASSFNTRRIENAALPTPTGVTQGEISRADHALVHPLATLRWTAAAVVSDDPDRWIPSQVNLDSGRWTDDRPLAKGAKSSPLPQAADGVTALAGRVLRLNGMGLAGISLKLGDASAITNDEGVFLLAPVNPGAGVLEVNGDVLDGAGDKYGFYQIRVNATPGRTTELGFDIWMTKLDPQGTVRISSPTTAETVISNPTIPGFELRIPAGTVIRGRDGKVVTEVSITAIPVNRPPFPLPDLGIPAYFTIQPGGAWLEGVSAGSAKGARIYYPNYAKDLPGSRGVFFRYDPHGKGWHNYGEGQINAEGTQAVPDPNTVIYEFTAAMFNNVPGAPPAGPPPKPSPCPGNCGCPGSDAGDGNFGNSAGCGGPGSDRGADPVSLSTGYFIHAEDDFIIPDVVPITLARTYRSQDTSQRTFGIGWVSMYDTMLYSQNPYQEVDLILSDGGRVHFARISPGVDYGDAVFESTAPGQWFKARVQRNNARFGWDLIFRDGSKWFFYEYQRLREITDASGNTLAITRRDNNGNAGPITRIQSPNGRYVDFTLDASGRVTQIKDNAGRVFSYTYDASGRLTKVTDPLLGERIYTYDTNNRLITVKDPNGNVRTTINQYDSSGRVLQQTLADSNTFQLSYTLSNGKIVQTDLTDQRGKVRRVEFNSSGYITKSTAAFGTSDAQQTTFVVNGNGQITSMTDPLNRVTSITYDSFGNPVTVTRLYGTSDAVTTTYAYTAGGERLASITDPLNHTTTFGYDLRWNLTSVTDALNHTTTYGRDTQGRVTSMTDALNHTWTYAYGGADLASVTDPLSRTTEIFTDAAGRVVAVKDPMGNGTTSEYDNLDHLKKVTNALSGAIEFGYDANGNLTSHKDQKGNTTTYSFNNLSLVSGKTDALLNAESYAYGQNARISRITDRKGQVTGLTYDNLNRVSQVGFGATVANPTAYSSTIGYTYDAGNRATQVADSAGGTITRTYDGLDRLTQEGTPEGTVSYTYDAAGRRATMTVAGQSQVTYTWDNADRLTQIAQGTDLIAFAYDDANRRTSTTLANGVVMAYGYDNANQLTSITYSKGGTTVGDLAYGYDAAGRRTSVSGSLATTELPAAVASAVYNANNQLTSWAGAGLTYDLNGNLTGDGANTYTWNARDQLAGISGGATASFVYDGVGRRRSKTVNSAQTGFLYDGLNFVQELNGSTVSANLVTGGIDEVFLRKEGSTARHFMSDALGSVIALTDAAGALQTQYSYDPYGKTTVSGSANSNSQRYTGREDDGTGLYYYRARYYSPYRAYFISEDPLGAAGGINMYQYVDSNPIDGIDPFGLANGGGRPLRPRPIPLRKPLPFDIKFTDCAHYPGASCEGKTLNTLCNFFGTDPKSNCSRRCLFEQLPLGTGGNPPLSWYYRDHLFCWLECRMFSPG